MPVRSLNSSVLKWPSRDEVDAALREWAREAVDAHPELRDLGYFGSYARDDWGVGSDLDVVAIVSHSRGPFESRALSWDLTGLPVPSELLVYTQEEWQRLQARGGRFARTLRDETVWILRSA